MERAPSISRGFTLIELMVVVAIITALIAILLPSLHKAIAISHIAVCGSNAKQMNFGFMSYHADNLFAVYPYPGNSNAAYPHFWMGKIAPYVNNLDAIRVCPEADTPRQDGREYNLYGSAHMMWTGRDYLSGNWIHRNEDGDGDGESDYWFGSYAMNGFMYSNRVGSYSNNYRSPGVPLANAPTFVDSAWADIWPSTYDLAGADFEDPRYGGNLGAGMVRSCLDRHTMGVNVAFMDGHVEYTKLGRLWWLNWSTNFVPGAGEPAL